MSVPTSPQIVAKMYDFLLYLVPQVSDFPRAQRYLLGDRLENLSFDALEFLLDAIYSRERMPLLHKINIKLDKIRYYVRLCKDLKLINLRRYEVMSKMINEVGVQLGGWIRQQKQRQ